jgi:hypothetical protein
MAERRLANHGQPAFGIPLPREQGARWSNRPQECLFYLSRRVNTFTAPCALPTG